MFVTLSTPSLFDRPVADFRRDVNDPDTKEAERLVRDYFRHQRGWSCIDVTKKHKSWDFEVYCNDGLMRLDVKADRNMDKTMRLPFETKDTYPNGHERLTWGLNPDLDIVAVVGIPSHQCIFAWVPRLRSLVERETRNYQIVPRGWATWEKQNEGYVTHGIAVPIRDARLAGCYHLEVKLPGAPL